MVKILCINSNGLHNDGITNSILNYYSHMNLKDFEIHLLETKETDAAIRERFEKKGLKLVCSSYRKNVLRYLLKTKTLIKKEQYDIVHVHGSSALLSLDLLAAALGGCGIRIAHSRNTTCNHLIIDKLLRPVFYRLCNVRFACGEEAGKWLFSNKSFTIIKNGKDLKKFSFDENTREFIRNEYNWGDNIVIGHVGNFNFQKNHDFLIDVFSLLSKKKEDYLLVLIGSGKDYLAKAKEKVALYGLEDKVIFTGSVDNVSELLQGMDIMLLPSHFEGLPNVVLEWQAEGLPAIISDKVTHECEVTNLLTYLPIDQGPECWVDAILNTQLPSRIEASSYARNELAKNGFDIEKDAKVLEKMYKSLVKGGVAEWELTLRH